MRRPQRGILCAGCPHRAAYIALKDASRRCRGRVICGDAGCPAVGELPPAAATCPGGAERLLPRYRVAVPDGGTSEHPAVETCIHIVPDTELAADDAVERLAGLAAEGRTTVLAVLASSRDFLARERIEWLGGRALALGASDVAVLDPFDTERCREVLCAQLAQPGVHGAVFASPCAQLQRGGRDLEPVEVDRYMCVGCHRCYQITGCPALSFEPPAYRVDPEACAGCDLCCGFCRTQVIYSPRSRLDAATRRRIRYSAAETGPDA